MAFKAGMLALLVFTALLSAVAEDLHVGRPTTEGHVCGKIVGSLGKSVEEYRGIPFAEPPMDKLRFRPPEHKAPWEGTLDATAGSAVCPQEPRFESTRLGLDPRRRLQFGSAIQANYSGTVMAVFADVLIVSMNYRLVIFGFRKANSPEDPGNVGLLDQDTVHETIATCNKVASIVGCSEGGTIDLSSNPEGVINCLRSKSAEELVGTASRSVAPKMVPFFPTYLDAFLRCFPIEATKRGFFTPVEVLAAVTSDQAAGFLLFPLKKDLVAEDLDATTPKELVDSLHAVLSRLWKRDTPDLLRMYVDDAQQGDSNALRRQYVDYTSDRLFNCPLRFFAEEQSERGGKVFAYVFAHKSATAALPGWTGQPRGFDIPFIFGERYAAEPASRDGRMSAAFMRLV
ncbi:hypothetical protein HPB49_007918 [Dermacentor silvarum]|uniref:Uncharacterized protein n=1 Tax=Dermacentor silvarum TaxID=543639 RepID=A0ACB8C2L0_DERSI|nr:hypothetical protein HPB49_007918 [Dermacentor silvarum]